jgi:hypothetical protein
MARPVDAAPFIDFEERSLRLQAIDLAVVAAREDLAGGLSVVDMADAIMKFIDGE